MEEPNVVFGEISPSCLMIFVMRITTQKIGVNDNVYVGIDLEFGFEVDVDIIVFPQRESPIVQ